MAAPFESDRTWTFPVGRAERWAAVEATDRYRDWWPWLRQLDAGAGLRTGEAWRCHVQPPLPYAVRFTIALDHVEPGHRAEATVTGDVQGRAVLTIAPGSGPDGERSATARLVSQLEPSNRVLQGFARVARPVVRWGHDWVLDTGQRQFVARAFDNA